MYGNFGIKNQLLHRLHLNYYLNAGFDCIETVQINVMVCLEIEYRLYLLIALTQLLLTRGEKTKKRRTVLKEKLILFFSILI